MDSLHRYRPLYHFRYWLEDRLLQVRWDRVIATALAFVIGAFLGAVLGAFVGAPIDKIRQASTAMGLACGALFVRAVLKLPED